MAYLPEPVTERRRLTRNSIYQYLYHADGPRSRTQIAQDLSLSMPTVHQNLSELRAAELVVPCGTQESTGGRRAACLTVAGNARFALGVSVTDRALRILAANLRMEEIAYKKVSRPGPPPSCAALGAALAGEIERFLTEFGLDRTKLLGVGIALPGVVNEEKGEITFSPTLHMRRARLDELKQPIPYPSRVSNDATAGGYAEWFARGEKRNIAYLSLEDGVGGAILLDGAPYAGVNGRSAEFGHICVEPGGLPCPCGKRGCLEAYCSASRLGGRLGVSLEDFFAGLARHDPPYEALWQDFLEHLATGINTIRMVLDCDVVLGGMLMEYMADQLPRLRALAAQRNTFENSGDYIRLCRHPKRGVPLGEALYFIRAFIEQL